MSTNRSRRTRTRACDACHIRRVKCDPLDGHNVIPFDVSRGLPCRQCREIRIECTFDRPLSRPPRPGFKARSTSSVASSSPQAAVSILDSGPFTPSPFPNDNGEVGSDHIMNTAAPISPTPSSIGPSFTPISAHDSSSIGRICDPRLVSTMIEDYMNILYPLIPVVHLPSFKTSYFGGRAESDPVFFSLVTSLCALVAVMLPRRFLEYQQSGIDFAYSKPAQFLQHCEELLLPLRDYGYYEEPTTEKCAISFNLGYICQIVGMDGRNRMYWAEMNNHIQTAGVDEPENHKKWNFIDTQVWKRLYWMFYIIEVHDRIISASIKGQPDWRPFSTSVDIAAIMPFEVDDDYVFHDQIGEQPSNLVSLMKGFNALTQIYLCFTIVTDTMDNEDDLTAQVNAQQSPFDPDLNGKYEHEALIFETLFERIRYAAADLPPSLAPWKHRSCVEPTDNLSNLHNHPNLISTANISRPTATRHDQIESIRANIHVTRLWARYLIFERLVTCRQQRYSSSALSHALLLSERETLCEQLLALLSNTPFHSLESNGVSITFKVRQIAALLLHYQPPTRPDSGLTDSAQDRGTSSGAGANTPWNTRRHLEAVSRRAQVYIDNFMELLAKLDAFTYQDTQQVIWNQP